MEILLKGIGVSFAVAAPVGPIGLLCIRRTLTQGRGAGIASGLGAAAADAVYGLLVAAGFAATGILMNYAGPLAIAGGVLIAILGLMSIRSFLRNANSSDIPKAAAASSGIYTAFATTFALTLSNPMTILDVGRAWRIDCQRSICTLLAGTWRFSVIGTLVVDPSAWCIGCKKPDHPCGDTLV